MNNLTTEQLENAVTNAINFNEEWLFDAFSDYCDSAKEVRFYGISEIDDFIDKNKDIFDIKDESELLYTDDTYFYYNDTIYTLVSFTDLSEDLSPLKYYLEDFIKWLSKDDTYLEVIKEKQNFDLQKPLISEYLQSIKDKIATGEITKIFTKDEKHVSGGSFYNFYIYDNENQEITLINRLIRYEYNEIFNPDKPAIFIQGSHYSTQEVYSFLKKFCTKEIIDNIKIEEIGGSDSRFY